MNTATLTANIAALPDRTRHIVAGICAYRLDNDKGQEFAPMWKLCHDHGKHYDWPTVIELALALNQCGLRVLDWSRELSVYDDYGDDVETAAVFRHRYEQKETYIQAAERKRQTKRYEFCGGAV